MKLKIRKALAAVKPTPGQVAAFMTPVSAVLAYLLAALVAHGVIGQDQVGPLESQFVPLGAAAAAYLFVWITNRAWVKHLESILRLDTTAQAMLTDLHATVGSMAMRQDQTQDFLTRLEAYIMHPPVIMSVSDTGPELIQHAPDPWNGDPQTAPNVG